MSGERIEVDRIIPADPAAIFEILRSPQGHVSIDSTGMLMWAEGDSATQAGDSFVVHMDRDALRDFPLDLYDVTVSFTRFDPDQAIEWTILTDFLDPPLGHVYGYQLEPVDGATKVTSYYDWSALADAYRGRIGFPIISETALRATLGILARTVAPGVARPVPPKPDA
jgi:hypothetical protein